jgi:hypothetical protein
MEFNSNFLTLSLGWCIGSHSLPVAYLGTRHLRRVEVHPKLLSSQDPELSFCAKPWLAQGVSGAVFLTLSALQELLLSLEGLRILHTTTMNSCDL